MKNYSKTFLGTILTFLFGFSCCFITSLSIWMGGATILAVLSKFVGNYQLLIFGIGFLLFSLGIFQFLKQEKV